MISIIIPVNNEKYLSDCLQRIRDNDYSDYEIIIVNNLPENKKIFEITKKFSGIYIEEVNKGSYRARNAGSKIAKGNLLAFIDADCLVDLKWLKEIDIAFKKNIDGLMGKNNGINKNTIAEYEQRFYEEVISEFINSNEKYLKRIDSRNFIIKKEIFKKMNGFNEQLQFGGDMEFGARLNEAGYKIIYSQNVIIEHINETDINKIIQKRFLQNFDNYNIIKFHSDTFNNKYFSYLYEYKNSYILKLINMILKFFLVILKIFSKLFCNYFLYKKINVISCKTGLFSNIVRS